jgi:CBS domain-containing membrane protein
VREAAAAADGSASGLLRRGPWRPRSWRASAFAWWPAPLPVSLHERWRAALGAGLGVLLVGLLSRSFAPGAMHPWLVAPLGASAVLVFALPGSPLARPWAVLGGNTLSALVGIACAGLVPEPALGAALAVAGAIGLMFALRCLHPPGGAMALLTALSGTTDWSFAAYPVLLNSALMVAAGLAYNRATRRRPAQPAGPAHVPAARRFSAADLDAVIARYDQVLDISREDLAALLHAAEEQAYRRRLGELRCADIMTRAVITVSYGTLIEEAWTLMRRHRVKALPVVDTVGRVIGIVTLADFMRQADLDLHEGWSERLRRVLRRTRRVHTSKPEAVGQIMTRQVRVASAERPVAELVPLFAGTGHHHIPVVGEGARLLGIVTQTDLVAAIARVG